MTRRIAARVLVLAAAVALGAPAAAIDKQWNYPGMDDWANGACWTPPGEPTAADSVWLNMGSPFISQPRDHYADVLYMGAWGGMGYLAMYDGTLWTSAQYVGCDGMGFFYQFGGTSIVTGMGDLSLGDQVGGFGSYYLAPGCTLQAYRILCGNQGTGVFNQHGGAVSTGALYIGASGISGASTYWLGGGTLDAPGGVTSYGTGALFIEGGTLATYGATVSVTDLCLGDDINRVGSHTLSGNASAVTERIGRRGTGTLTQNTGTHDVSSLLSLGIEAEGNGTLNLGGGILNTHTVLVGTAGAGLIAHSGGEHHDFGSLRIGNGAGSGTYELSGTGYLDAAEVRVGNGGTGTFNQTGGTAWLAGPLYISAAAGGAGGTVNLGGTGELIAPTVYVGYAYSGAMKQTGGFAYITTKLYVGYGGFGHGIYRLSGGDLAAPEIQVGNGLSVTGRFEWFGGTVSTTLLHLDNGTLEMGFNFNVADLLSGSLFGGAGGGTITGLTQNNLSISNGAAATHSAAAGATLGGLTVGSGNGAGTYNLGGDAILAVNNLLVGWGGTGTFNQTGGTATVSGGIFFLGAGGTAGMYNLSAGSLTTNYEIFGTGDGAAGVFNQSGGVHIVGMELRLGDATDTPGAGTYNLTGGSLSATTEAVGCLGAGAFTHTGGTNTVVNLRLGWAGAGAYTLGGTGALVATAETVGAGAQGTFTQTGGTHTVTGTLAVSPTGAGGTFSLEGGRLTAATVNLSAGGTFRQTGGTLSAATFNQNGGTVEGQLENRGTFNYTGGTFTGRLINLGTANFAADFTAGDGLANYTTLSVPLGRTFSFGGLGLLNAGTLSLDGGVINGPGPVTNDFGGAMSGRGTLNADFFNNGTLALTGLLAVSGSAANAGAITVNATQNLHVGGNFANTGIVTLGRGALVADILTNGPGGVIEGAGGVTAAVTNSGGLIHASGATPLVISDLSGGNTDGGEIWVENASTLSVGTALANAGTVLLKGDAATLACGPLVNTGTIRGKGRLAGAVANGGILRAEGGQLTVSGPGSTNAAAGRIEIPAGAAVFFTQGLATNSGTVALVGGTLDNNNRPLVNSGGITGFGTLRTGGLTNSPGKTVGVGGGNMDVFGTVDNDGPWTVMAGCTTTFYDFVHGTGNFPGAGTVVFLAGYSPGGSPARIGFGGDVVLAAAALLMELAGRSPGAEYDALDVAGLLALGGTLEVALADGFAPRAGDSFDLLDWGGLAGAFDAVNLPDLGDGLAWDLSGLYASGTVGVVPEPATLALAALGAAGALLRRRRQGGRCTPAGRCGPADVGAGVKLRPCGHVKIGKPCGLCRLRGG
ncbi:MAG: PEP-CTERM sorting domain-containing protein [Planctomycetes bacterium]|nr:PEP-CTERM sorting domain-containing protein [Planctomycetota bacterium]